MSGRTQDQDFSVSSRDDLRDQVGDIRRRVGRARLEAFSGVVDGARAFMRQFGDSEPYSRSNDWGDVARRTPDTVLSAAQAALDRFGDIPRRMSDAYYDSSSKPKASRYRGSRSPEQQIVDETTSYLDGIPGSGASLDGAIQHVHLRTDYDEALVRKTIKRHFVHNDKVITKGRHADIGEPDDTLEWMRQRLSDAGYTDLRDNVALDGVDDVDEDAQLVAYHGNKPIVLAFVAEPGRSSDLEVREAAHFQASVIAGGPAQFLFINDGEKSVVVDVEKDRLLKELPKAKPSAAGSKS